MIKQLQAMAESSESRVLLVTKEQFDAILDQECDGLAIYAIHSAQRPTYYEISLTYKSKLYQIVVK